MGRIEPTPLGVTVAGRRVPAVLWRSHAVDAPLVLLGHGGSGHKTGARQQLLADRLVAQGLTVLAIDGPAHGERSPRPDMTPGEYHADLAGRGVESVVRDMTDDWVAAVDSARAAGALGTRVGYLGLSKGTRFGLPLAATLNDELTCLVLGKFGLALSAAMNPGLHDADQLRRDAESVRAPTLWHVQWDDELFPRAGQLEMFDRLGSTDKRLIVFPGDHRTTDDDAVEAWLRFLVRHLHVPPGHGGGHGCQAADDDASGRVSSVPRRQRA